MLTTHACAQEMVAYQKATMEDWCAMVGDISEQKLKLPLLTCAPGLSRTHASLPGPCIVCSQQRARQHLLAILWAGREVRKLNTADCVCRQEEDGQHLLRVNFDPALVRVLREVHYFLLLPDLPQQVPAPALKVRAALMPRSLAWPTR